MLFQQMLFWLANFFSRNITIFHTFATSLQKQKNMSFFSQKDYKMLHRPVFAAFLFLVYLEKYFQEYRLSFPVSAARLLQRKCPEAFLSLRAFRSEYLLQMQQHLCNVEVDQQRGGIHNGGDQG